MAARYLTRAETTVAEALKVLAELRVGGHVTCSLADRTVFGMAAFNSEFIVQIGLTDEAGTLICGEPMGALAAPARLPVTEKGDPSVMLSVLSDGKDRRQAVVTLRVDDRLRLVARLAGRALDIDAGASYFEDSSVTSVYLDDGSEWSKLAGKWAESDKSAALISVASSERYPIKVRVAVDEAAAQKSIAGLRTITIVLSTLAGLGVFIIVTWSMWRQSDGDSFSRAVDNHEFIPYYQPVFDLMTGEIRGCEVLVRWIRPDGTMVPPGQFLAYAEATGAIRDITRQLMTQTV
ncbi:MAG: yahA, partial [Proteobacteria bacterium]|nr:yahA [Pseudomonadota bacterium]